jgi:hypothetical protein
LKRFEDSVTVELQGGLGNQLFGWAAGLSIARKLNRNLALNTNNLQYRPYELHNFNLEEEVTSFNQSISRWHRFSRTTQVFSEKSFRFDPHFTNIDEPVILKGYFQSPKYFESEAELVRRLVALKNPTTEYLKLEADVSQFSTLAIHIRRGDYVGLQNYHGLTSERYFDNAITVARKVQNFDKTMVFSDDINLAKKIVPSADSFISSSELASAAENLILMSKCNGLIGSNSSFSWWGGFLGDDYSKIRIFPRPWFTEKNIDTRDLLLNHWLTLGI